MIPVQASPFRDNKDKKIRAKCLKMAINMVINKDNGKPLLELADEYYKWIIKPYNQQ